MDVANKIVYSLLDTGDTYSVTISFSGPLSSQFFIILSVAGKSMTRNFTLPLGCLWDKYYFTHSFLIVPECPTPLLGRDLLQLLGTRIVNSRESYLETTHPNVSHANRGLSEHSHPYMGEAN